MWVFILFINTKTVTFYFQNQKCNYPQVKRSRLDEPYESGNESLGKHC